jgi:CubicO group peptidase (beta-lactamase class C family)
LKTIVPLLLLAVLFYGCNTSSGNKKPVDDSLQYYPPTPVQLDKEEFRNYYRQLNSFFDTSLLNADFNGSILIAKNGSVIYEKYVGKIDVRKKDSLNDSVSLHIASTTKTFTSVAVLRLVDENKLSLNDTLDKFFPGFPYPGITVKMLLNHRSGLPNYLYFISNSKWDKKKYATNEDMLNIMTTNKPDKTFSPDKRFSYCNTNYVLLAMIIEKVTGKSFPDYMQQKYFDPLQMKHTYVFTLKDTLTAAPSFTNNNTYWEFDCLDATYGDKNIYTTARDLLKWDQALYTDQIISKAMMDSAFSPQSFDRKDSFGEKPSVDNYGLGWRLQLLPNGKKVVYHFGKWHGFNAAFARLTDEKVTIIILGNKFTRSIYTAAQLCYDIFGDYQQHTISKEDEAENLQPSKIEAPAETKKKKVVAPAKGKIKK